ncbi:MAG: hypothetical protein J5640_05035 [Bacteroidales bacterium]|nr:hypothetical protein [Bacteroidales bacterium]
MKTNNYWLQFIISVLGTAIGVGLTFGLNGILEKNKQNQAQRLTAIMAIHDIDNTIDELKSMKKNEEKYCELLEYAVARKDRLDTVPYDTLTKVINCMLDRYTERRFDTSKEKIFNSDLDTWQNLGNMKFIDNVQSFFYNRQSFLEDLNHSDLWHRPIPEAEYMQLFMGIGWLTMEKYCELASAFLKKKLGDNRVIYYIDVAGYRVDNLKNWIDSWTALNEENKFLMGITDKEMDDYINSFVDNGVAVTRRSLTGSWTRDMEDDNSETITFSADNSFTAESVSTISNHWEQWSGKYTTRFTYSGTWEMKGDSLIMIDNPLAAEMVIDGSALVPYEGGRDSVDAWINRTREQELKEYREKPEAELRGAFKARLDSSHDKMEWTYSNGGVVYLKRK